MKQENDATMFYFKNASWGTLVKDFFFLGMHIIRISAELNQQAQSQEFHTK